MGKPLKRTWGDETLKLFEQLINDVDGLVRDGRESERRDQRLTGAALRERKDPFPPGGLLVLDDVEGDPAQSARYFDGSFAEGLLEV
jgi:hypothetical protein